MNENEGRATDKQIGFLRTKGVSEEELANLTKKQASDLIGKALDGDREAGPQRTLAGLLRGADNIMEHLNTSTVYGSLSETGKVAAFTALIDAYARMNNTLKISESKSKRAQEKVTT